MSSKLHEYKLYHIVYMNEDDDAEEGDQEDDDGSWMNSILK